MDKFVDRVDILDEYQFNDDFENEIKRFDYKTCDNCNKSMNNINGNTLKCINCGLIKDISCDSVCSHGTGSTNYNSSSGSIEIVGKNSKSYNKASMVITSDYNVIRKRNTMKYLVNKNYSSKLIGQNILHSAADKFHNMQDNIVGDEAKLVKRGACREGSLGACIYFTCIEEGVGRKKREIAQMLGIRQQKLSKEEENLRKLCAEGKINLPLSIDRTEHFINRYFESLGIPDNYKGFVSTIVKDSIAKRISMTSDVMSKCTGAIYILVLAKKINVTAKDIDSKCDVKKNTFTKFANEIIKHKNIFKETFEQYGIII